MKLAEIANDLKQHRIEILKNNAQRAKQQSNMRRREQR
jgi:16S rRNA C967 or C1407 C5-methylase (RsmB/RsmF family)